MIQKHYFEFGRAEGRSPNRIFNSFDNSEVAFVASANLTAEQFQTFKDASLANNNETEVALAPAIPVVIYYLYGAIAVTVVTPLLLESANNLQELIADSEVEVYISTPPFVGPLLGKDVPLGFPAREGEVRLTTPPFQLGKVTVGDELKGAPNIDRKIFTTGNEFLEDILDGQFEFPAEGESTVHFANSARTYDLSDEFYEGAIENKEGEPSLKTTSFENARNEALERLGEIDSTTRTPVRGRLGVGRGKTVGFTTTVNGVFKRYRLDWDEKKQAHINIEVGKGISAKKLAVEFPGTEADVERLLKGLQ